MHGTLTSDLDFRAGSSSCSMTNSFVTNALIERAVSCWHLHQLISWITRHNTWIVGCQIYSKVNYKWNCWKSRGARAPVPHSWGRHCLSRIFTLSALLTYSVSVAHVHVRRTSKSGSCQFCPQGVICAMLSTFCYWSNIHSSAFAHRRRRRPPAPK